MPLPSSVSTVRIVFDSPDLQCCVAIHPATVPINPDTGNREVVLRPLPAGPATVTLSGYPGNTAPAPPGGPTEVCATVPVGVGAACVAGAPDTPSFTSEPTSLTVQPGGIADLGQIHVHSVPFVVPSTRMPPPGDTAASPVQIGFVVGDALSDIDPLSVQVQLIDAEGTTSALPVDLSPCDDASGSVCTPGGALDVRGLRASAAPQILPAGFSTVHVIARNLSDPPQSVDTLWRFRAGPTPAPPTATDTPAFTPTPTLTRTPTSTPTRSSTPTLTSSATASATRTVTRTPTVIPTSTPSSTRRPIPTSTETSTARPTSTLQPTSTRRPTSTPTPPPTFTPTPSNTPSPTPTRTITSTRTITPTIPPCTQEAPNNPCIPGSRSGASACDLEWLLSPPPFPGSDGIPRRSVSCDDGSTCDVDGKTDGQCTFRIALCINNQDPRRFLCAPFQVDSVGVRAPNPSRLLDVADVKNLAALEGAAGKGGLGLRIERGDQVIFPGAPNDTLNLCGQPFDIVVPIRAGTTGRRHLKLRVSAPHAISSSTVRLSCIP